MVHTSRSVESPRVTPGWDTEDLSGLSQAVIVTQTRAHMRDFFFSPIGS